MIISNDLLAGIIHYPWCWDVTAFPTLTDAVMEIEACLGEQFISYQMVGSSLPHVGWVCSDPDCPHRSKENSK